MSTLRNSGSDADCTHCIHLPGAGESFTEVTIVRIHFVMDETDAVDRERGIMSPSIFLK